MYRKLILVLITVFISSCIKNNNESDKAKLCLGFGYGKLSMVRIVDKSIPHPDLGTKEYNSQLNDFTETCLLNYDEKIKSDVYQLRKASGKIINLERYGCGLGLMMAFRNRVGGDIFKTKFSNAFEKICSHKF